jgi:hypothetical protein
VIFDPIVPNPNIDVHPNPPGLWDRVAIVCRWKDAHAFRRNWPHASIVGPLRTLRGLDEFLRNLLHNPQIRVVILDGNDLTPGEETTSALNAVWRGETADLQADLHPFVAELVDAVRLYTKREALSAIDSLEGPQSQVDLIPFAMPGMGLDQDRPSGRITLPPPPPKADAPAPHGDPGERVSADTIAELWPMVLHRAMRFGRIMPTQYGDTRELLNLVAVIRNPLGDSGMAEDKVDAYFRRITGEFAPEGAPYSYGSRMHGTCSSCNGDRHIETGDTSGNAPCPACSNRQGKDLTDQFFEIMSLLRAKPDTRAAFLTPWRPEEDSGIESGRPCLVGAWLRVTGKPFVDGNWHIIREEDVPDSDWLILRLNLSKLAWQRMGRSKTEAEVRAWAAEDCSKELERKVTDHPRLHMTIMFRSHDLFGAWPTNLAGIARWLGKTAESLGMGIGTLTCVSCSAHVYAKDWADSDKVIAERYEKNHEPRWDQRSSWHVELIRPVTEEKPVVVGEALQVPRSASGVLDVWEVQAEPVIDRDDHVWIENCTTGVRQQVSLHDWREKRGDYRGPQPKPTLRATALTPDGREVIRVFDAETPEGLRGQIERSGLVTSVGAALWLGDEIRKVVAK